MYISQSLSPFEEFNLGPAINCHDVNRTYVKLLI